MNADRPPIARSIRTSLFPILLWGFAALFLGGTLGEWSDDYAYDRRDYVTGSSTLPFGGYLRPYFYRPLYYLLVPELQTRLGAHDWMLHALSAAIHGTNSLLLWVLLRKSNASPRIAAGAALVFLVYPAPWEVVFWPAAIPTGLATGSFLGVCLLFLARARGRARWWRIPVLALLSFVIVCLNEQPATGLAALPALLGGASLASRPRRWIRAWAASLGAVVLYIALFVFTAPANARGGSGTFIALHDLGAKCRATLAQINAFMLLPNFRRGAFSTGLAALGAAPLLTAVFLSLTGASLVPWARRWLEPGNTSEATSRGHAYRAAFGASVFILGWIPVILFRGQGVEPRLCYSPAIGAVIFFAGLADAWLEPRLVRSRRCRFAAGGGLLVLLSAGAIMLIGIQAAMQKRWTRDLAQVDQLRTLFPSPAQGSVFVPVRIDEQNTQTGAHRFDTYFYGPMERAWSGCPWIRRGYHRRDLAAGFWSPYADWHPALMPSASGFVYDDRFLGSDELKGEFPRDDRGAKVIPWAQTIPILIDREGLVRPVGSIRIGTDGARQTFPVPQVQSSSDRSAAIALDFDPAHPGSFTVDWNPSGNPK